MFYTSYIIYNTYSIYNTYREYEARGGENDSSNFRWE